MSFNSDFNKSFSRSIKNMFGLLDGTYFIGELSLPNIPASTCGDASDGVALAIQSVGESNLSVFIDKYILKYLVLLMGKDLAMKFLEGIKAARPDQLWIDIRNQLFFEFGSYKASPMANYVYYMICRDAVTKTTQAGEADPDFDFARNASNTDKFINAWNDMVDLTVPVVEWLCRNGEVYESYAGCETGRNVCAITKRINRFGI